MGSSLDRLTGVFPAEEDLTLALGDVPFEIADVLARVHGVHEDGEPFSVVTSLDVHDDGCDVRLPCQVLGAETYTHRDGPCVGLKEFEIFERNVLDVCGGRPPDREGKHTLDAARDSVESRRSFVELCDDRFSQLVLERVKRLIVIVPHVKRSRARVLGIAKALLAEAIDDPLIHEQAQIPVRDVGKERHMTDRHLGTPRCVMVCHLNHFSPKKSRV